MRFCPAKPEPDANLADLGVLVDSTGITGDVQTRNTKRRPGARDRHDVVEDGCRCLARALAVVASLETDGVHGRVDDGLADDLLDHVGQFGALGEIYRFAAETPSLRKAFTDHVADDHY